MLRANAVANCLCPLPCLTWLWRVSLSYWANSMDFSGYCGVGTDYCGNVTVTTTSVASVASATALVR